MTVVATSLLTPEIEQQVRDELRDNERLVWAGQPSPARLARRSLPIMLFGIPFFGFAVFWTSMATWGMWFAGHAGGSSPPLVFRIFFPLFGLPFLLVGAGMLASPCWTRRTARRTVYVLTSRRAFVISGTFRGGKEVRSYGPDDMTDMHRSERRDGSGDLIFREVSRTVRGKHGTREVSSPQGFFGVAAVAELERLVRETLHISD